ncbi:condensation domain-containing protein, partial [Maribacter sp. 2-571]|uniref:condensation domain-containing protein n=1 Tax=Maribacter sp. 2-571 TaxID=3417569 RepID=UPI003D354482
MEYHIPMVMRLEGALDVSVLESSMSEIVSRHEVLRTVIVSDDGVGWQQVMGADGWSLDVEGISDRSLLDGSIDDFVDMPFDLSSDYMLRARLYDLGSDEYVLATVLHHIASDGWSEGVMMGEFLEIYEAFSSGVPASLPPLPIQYSDYAIWQRGYLEGELLDGQLSYWEAMLRGGSVLELPTDYRRTPDTGNEGGNITLELDADLSEGLLSLSRKEGATLFMTLLSAFKVLLSRYSGQEDISVGTPIANRTQEELEGLIGFFVNTLVLRSDLGGDPKFREFLAQVRETTLGAYDHQLAPFEKVVERVVKTR